MDKIVSFVLPLSLGKAQITANQLVNLQNARREAFTLLLSGKSAKTVANLIGSKFKLLPQHFKTF